jgi:general secretion pathway protein K
MAGRRGIAMVTAVMIVSVAAGVAAYLVVNPERWGRQTANMAAIAQAEVTARAAVDWGREIIYDNEKTPGLTTVRIGENGPVVINTFPVEDGTLTMSLENAQANFNLNNLVKLGKPSVRDILAFKRLLLSLKLPIELADSVASWMGANRQLGDVSELTAITGFTAEVMKELSPHVTVLPDRALVNVNAAGAPVLMGVFKGLSMTDAENLVATRKSDRFSSVANLRGRLPRSVTEVLDDDFTVNSKFFTVKAVSSFKHAKIRAEALLRVGEKDIWPNVVWYRLT